jgi:hypothetical protein
MQPAGIGIGWPWIAGLALLALAGLFVIWRGLYPRRQGTTPYCRKCGYNLTGTDRTVADARCSECGSHVTADTAVIFGERTRRWRRIFVGLVIFLLGTAPLVLIGVGVARGIDWYRYKPTTLVLRDIQSTSPALATKAIQEMTRRFNAGSLAPEQIARLAETCLTVHAQPSQSTQVSMPAIHLLDAVYRRDRLTPAQTKRFFSQMVDFSPLVRARVIQGDPCYLGVKCRERGPVNRYPARISVEDVRLDEESVWFPWCGEARSYTGYSEMNLGTPYVGELEPGAHSVKIAVAFEIYEQGYIAGVVSESSALYSEQRTVNASFEILEKEPPNYFRLTHSPELDRAVAARISVSELTMQSDKLVESFGVPAEQQAEVHIRYAGPHPIGLAFDVYAEVDGHRLGLGQITASKDSRYGISGRGFAIPVAGEVPNEVTIILRSSKAAALRTPDLYEIWDGELWFEDVEVVSEKPATQPWPLGGRFKPMVRRRDPSDDQAWPAVADSFLPPVALGRRPLMIEDIDDPDLAAKLRAAFSTRKLGSEVPDEALAKLAERLAEQMREDLQDARSDEVPREGAALKLTHSPELDEVIAARLRLSEFSAEKNRTSWGLEGRRRLQGVLWFAGPLPVGVAFEVFAEINDRRIQSNWPITESPGGIAGRSHGVGVSFPYDGDPPDTITVILRSSKAAAMRTPDLCEIWDGELRFENVEIVPPDHISWSWNDHHFAPRVTPRRPATTQETTERH